MNKIRGMKRAFEEAKLVYLTTTSRKGEKRTRPMTNFNKSPYEPMWFPSFKNSRKIIDINHKPSVTISFPTKKEGIQYMIDGEASEAPQEEVREIWKWWLLEWVPEKDRKPLHYDNPFTDRAIIWVKPMNARVSDSREQP